MLLLERGKKMKLFLWTTSVYARIFPEALNSETFWAHYTNLPAFIDLLFCHLYCVPIAAKRPCFLRHVRPSIRIYQRGCHQTDLREIGFWDFLKYCLEVTGFVKIGQKYWAFYLKTYVGFAVAGDIKPP